MPTGDSQNTSPSLFPIPRFAVDQRVLCKTDEAVWLPGTVVQLNYREPWMQGTAPYQVRLDDGDLIYVPWDDDSLCQKFVPAWWAAFFSEGRRFGPEHTTLLAALLERGQPVNLKDHYGDTLLLASLRHGWLEGASIALQRGADPNLGSSTEVRPLHLALRLGLDAARLLLAAHADPNLQDLDPERKPDYASATFQEREWHRTALHYAAMRNADLCLLLLDSNADPLVMDAHYKHPLHLAIEAGQIAAVELLLARGADPNAGNTSIGMTSTPLIDAAYRGATDLVRKLLHGRADVNRQGKQGMAALHVAARGKHAAVAWLLLAAGADASLLANGKTAAELAALNGAHDLAAKMAAQQSPHLDSPLDELDAATRAALCLD